MPSKTKLIETEERTLQQLLSPSEAQLADINQALKLTEKPLETYLQPATSAQTREPDHP